MVPELTFYQREQLFSHSEIRQMVKRRRADEYQMQRKDAEVSFFLKAVEYEKELWNKKRARKSKKPKKS